MTQVLKHSPTSLFFSEKFKSLRALSLSLPVCVIRSNLCIRNIIFTGFMGNIVEVAGVKVS